MAVTAGPADFARLKLRLMRNGFRGHSWRVAFFASGALFALVAASAACFVLASTGTKAVDRGVAYLWAAVAGTAIVLGWTLVPLLFFGVDETVDPARFALLPVPGTVLLRGMLAAAFVSVPAIATLIGSSGLVVGAVLRFDPLAGGTALLGVVAGLLTGVLASRAVTSAFAALLRSRRVRELAIMVMAILASSIGPLQLVGLGAAQRGGLDGAERVAEVLGWTPLAAPYVLFFDVAEGRWLAAGARTIIVLATIALLFWWWSRTLESAMIGVSSNAPARAARVKQSARTHGGRPGHAGTGSPASPVAAADRARAAAGTVDVLLLGGSRWLMPASPFGAIMARESRSWWRDARRRASLISILMASAVLPFSLSLAGDLAPGTPGMTIGYSFAVSMAGTISGMLLGNQFAYDGSAYAAHLLTHVSGRVELRARAAALAIVVLPVQAGVVVAVTLLTSTVEQVPAALGLLATGFGAAIAAAGVLSVFAAYPLPDTSNPFALNSGGGGAKGLLAVVAVFATLIISSPVTATANLISHGTGIWLLPPLGLAYGLLLAVFSTRLAGDALDRRGPELLWAVSPRR